MNKEIKKLIKKSSEGDVRSKGLLGFEYWSGQKIDQDFNLAMKLWKEVSKLDEPIASFNVATMYSRGDGLKQNYKKAHEFHELCISSKKKKYLACKNSTAKKFQRDSHFFLGQMFFLGNYKKDIKKGIYHYEKAFELGHFHACYLLGFFHDKDAPNFHGIKKNMNKAIKYYELSAKFNYFPSFAKLCMIYGLGENVKKNLNLFNLYYKKAMSINNKIIKTKLDIGDQKQEQINRIRLNLKKLAKTIKKNNEK